MLRSGVIYMGKDMRLSLAIVANAVPRLGRDSLTTARERRHLVRRSAHMDPERTTCPRRQRRRRLRLRRALHTRCSTLTPRVLCFVHGERVSHRERALARHLAQLRTAADLLRLVPLAILSAAPFGTVTLPVITRYFPSLLPTSFKAAQVLEKCQEDSRAAAVTARPRAPSPPPSVARAGGAAPAALRATTLDEYGIEMPALTLRPAVRVFITADLPRKHPQGSDERQS